MGTTRLLEEKIQISVARFRKFIVHARSKFWSTSLKLCKIKKSNGYIVSCDRLVGKNSIIGKNFGLWVKFQTRTGNQYAFKEFRDTTINGAVHQLQYEMASRHKTDIKCIQLIKTVELVSRSCQCAYIMQYHNSKVWVTLARKMLRSSSKKFRETLKGKRPKLFWVKIKNIVISSFLHYII